MPPYGPLWLGKDFSSAWYNGKKEVMLCSWEGNRGFDINWPCSADSVVYLSTYGLNGLRKGDDYATYGMLQRCKTPLCLSGLK